MPDHEQDVSARWLTIKQAARRLGVSPVTLRRWDRAGKLGAHRHPATGHRLYAVSDIERLAASRQPRSPAPVSDRLLGRERELCALGEALEAVQLVTLVGIGGVGKTAVARAFATVHGRGFTTTWCCELAGAATEAEILARMAAQRAIPLAAEREAITALGACGRGLLVLDDCDAGLAALAPLVQRWLAHAGGLRVLCTSRRPLGLCEERVLAVEPLERDAAIALYRQRCAEVSRGAAGEPAGLVAQLVDALDRLPLAIELAAARARVLGAADLLDRLDRRLDELRAGAGHVPPRHASLRAVLDDAWQHLDDAQKHLLARLAVFRGGFDLPAAEAVAARGGDVAADLEVLCAHSLVHARRDTGGRPRFQLLDSVAAHAAEHLDDGDACERAHAAHYARLGGDLARRHDRSGTRATLAALVRERDNLMVAWSRLRARDPLLAGRVVLALAPVAIEYGPPATYLEAFDDALAGDDMAEPAVRAQLHLARARLRSTMGDNRGSAADGRAARILFEGLGDHAGIALALCAEAIEPHRAGRCDVAETLYRRAAEHADAADDGRARARVALSRGLLGILRGDPRAAQAHFETSVACARAARAPYEEAYALSSLASAHLQQGDLNRAEALCRAAIAIEDAHLARRHEATDRALLATVLQHAGRHDDARAAFRTAVDIARGCGQWIAEALACANWGVLEHVCGDLPTARGCLERAAELFVSGGHRREHALVTAHLGAVAAAEGDVCRARACLTEARCCQAGADLAATVEILAGFIDLAELARAARRDRRDLVRGALDAALDRLETATPALLDSSEDVRSAVALLENRIEALTGAPPNAQRSAPAILVSADRAWVESAPGAAIDLGPREVLQRLLGALLAARAGPEVPAERLIAEVWPGERILPEAAAARLWSAVSALRKLGLGTAVERRGAGYRLAPDRAVVDLGGAIG